MGWYSIILILYFPFVSIAVNFWIITSPLRRGSCQG
jgi:hypothetical protein